MWHDDVVAPLCIRKSTLSRQIAIVIVIQPRLGVNKKNASMYCVDTQIFVEYCYKWHTLRFVIVNYVGRMMDNGRLQRTCLKNQVIRFHCFTYSTIPRAIWIIIFCFSLTIRCEISDFIMLQNIKFKCVHSLPIISFSYLITHAWWWSICIVSELSI